MVPSGVADSAWTVPPQSVNFGGDYPARRAVTTTSIDWTVEP